MPDTLRAHRMIHARPVWGCVLLLAFACAPPIRAADAAFTWASLSGEQQYILSGFAARWAKLDVATRSSLVARADARSMKVGPAPGASGDAAEKGKTVGKPAASYKSSRRRRNLSVAEASLSAHSLRLRRTLRDLPGLSVNERRALLERWGDLTSRERLKMVERYTGNSDDDEALRLQQALADGSLSKADLARGLASGKLDAGDIKDALNRGSLSAGTLKEGIASRSISAENVERVMREGNIESKTLSNAIDHHRSPSDGVPTTLSPSSSP